MTISFSSQGSAASDIAFAYSTWTISGVTLSAGDFVFYLFNGDAPVTGLSVLLGASALTQIGTTTGDLSGSWWALQGFAGGSGQTITVTATGHTLATVAANWGILTGENFASLATTFYGNLSTFTNSPPYDITVTATVPSGGYGIISVGAQIPGNVNPTTWANATGYSAMEASVATSNGAAVSGASTSTAGSTTFGATATGTHAWSYAGANIAALTMSASGGGGGSNDDRAFQNGAITAATLSFRERMSGLLEPVRELWKPKRPRVLVPGFTF